jgi:dihydropteroate synthase
MGVLNVTPDSFSDGGRYTDPLQAAEEALRMAAGGADIIDIGGESSRPGSKPVQASEEIDRVMPVIEALAGKINVPLSVDTYKGEVARAALSRGVSIVNDIKALKGSDEMAGVIAEFDAGVVLMHMKGFPEDMQKDPSYDKLMEEVSGYLAESVNIAENAGVDPGKIIIDPGIGFGKTLEHNLILLRNLQMLKSLGKPILAGTSRKSFIGSITGKDVTDRAFGTAASVAVAIMNGADIIRVHDVDQMRDVARIVDAITGA